MFIPKNMRMHNLAQMHSFIDQFSFGLIVNESLSGTHLPFILDSTEGEFGTLYCHFARANPHWKEVVNNKALVVFSGPHSYVSPTWYTASPNVPTWNYAAVHAYGDVELIADDKVHQVLDQTVAKYEPELIASRQVVTTEFQEKLAKYIVACKIPLSKIEGKIKLGQHRSAADQQGVVLGLEKSHSSDAIGLLDYMRASNIGLGTK